MKRPNVSAVLLLLAALGWGACYSLDPFVYRRARVDAYHLSAEGSSPEETVTPERIELVDLRVDERIRLGAVYVKAARQPSRGQVLYFHGICCSLELHVDRAKRLSNLGFDVLAFDYRGWGTSTNVDPTEAGLIQDSQAALDWLSARGGVSADRIIYYGRSFGTAVASQFAVVHPPAALILESPFSSMQGLVEDSSQMDLPVGFVSRGRWDTEHHVRAMQGVPLLLLHGTADDFIRPEFSQRLYALAHEPKRLVLVEGADHDTVPALMGENFARTLDAFLADTGVLPAPPDGVTGGTGFWMR